ncbi:hypothetical protein DPMN_073866 [Dreissena polymorpha]|uniref:Uncharacterized protein n=1 Tax=Dreissena polymorpha TaxID=45954 RepID=A0A9D3YI24_DREPO|nr:hypothetical protein DPMN_073866 [Dreissena polymorpha]
MGDLEFILPANGQIPFHWTKEGLSRNMTLLELFPVVAANQDLLNFIAYLANQKMSATTAFTYISGIAYAHKLKQINNTTKSFIVVKALEGLRRKKREPMQLLP